MNIIIESFGNIISSAGEVWKILSTVWFIVFPVAFYYLFRMLWGDFAAGKFWGSIEWTLLEIIPPNDIEKSPQPMEVIFSGLLGSMAGINIIEEHVDGKSPMFFSLELVSDEGAVHFFIRTPKVLTALVESHIYAQYPNSEIMVVPDYVNDVPKIIPNRDWNLWGTDFILDKPDPYPIKTYKWFEESVTGTMIDPLAGLIETMGKIGPGEKIWFQYIITPKDQSEFESGRAIADELAGRAKPKKMGAFSEFIQDWGDIIKSVPAAMMGPVELPDRSESSSENVPVEFALTPGEKEVLKAVEESIGKSAFETKMRFLYLGRREVFDKVSVGSTMGSVKQFSDINLNGFKADNTSKTFAIHLFAAPRVLYRQRKILRRYRDRDRSGNQFILNTEELATVFHFPDMSVSTPAVKKVSTKRGSAPANLPIQ
ncbi:MAG: hypothetical protein OEV93_04240 [Candidatus Moranbacteria bacterium]|nr:hypothetical protein [Candidatus Moranbacteria bacterium]